LVAKKGFQTMCPLEMEARDDGSGSPCCRAYVFADEYPVAVRGGRRPLVGDAELVALAVAQAAIGIGSDRQSSV
jgi:hypothetical protein